MVIRFADCVIDTEARRLFQSGHEIHLAPKAFELLIMLIVARPRALDKAELQQRVWPATFVAEANLPVLIGQIREALGDAARKPRFIRTVHRFGYAFCGTAGEVPARGTPATFERSQCWIATRTRRMPLVCGENLVGRDPTATVWLDRPSVSRHHARIVVFDDHATIEDLGSKNGTYVRGRPIVTAERLYDSDRIVIGSLNFIFRRPSGASSTKTGVSRRMASALPHDDTASG
jgi:DNA-binding winged helix-turn-helix (wHTH) protein